MSVEYSQEVYNAVVAQQQENDLYLKELYNSLPTLIMTAKIETLKVIDALKVINDEYEKYIIIYDNLIGEDNPITTYVIIEGDTLQRIAYLTLGDPSKWDLLYRFNNLGDVKLEPGDTLNIPDIG